MVTEIGSARQQKRLLPTVDDSEIHGMVLALKEKGFRHPGVKQLTQLLEDCREALADQLNVGLSEVKADALVHRLSRILGDE